MSVGGHTTSEGGAMVPPLTSSSLNRWWWSPAMIHRLCSVLPNPMSVIRVKEGGMSTVAGDDNWYALCWDSLWVHKEWIEGWHLANQDTSPNFIYLLSLWIKDTSPNNTFLGAKLCVLGRSTAYTHCISITNFTALTYKGPEEHFQELHLHPSLRTKVKVHYHILSKISDSKK